MGVFQFPDQTIPESKKDKDFHIQHAVNHVSFAGSHNHGDAKSLMLKYYRAYNAELNEEEQLLAKSTTCPNGIDLGVEYIVYPLIQIKTEQILGEFILRPLRRKAYVVDKKSKNKKYEEKLKMLSEELMRDLKEDLKEGLGFDPQTEGQDIQLPEDVEEFFEKDFKMLAEETTDSLINFILDVRKEKNKFKEIFSDYCIVDRCHAVIDKKNGHPTIRKVHPLDANNYDIDPYKNVQDDHSYFFEDYYLTENEVYNSFSLTPSEKKLVKEFFETMSGYTPSSSDGGDLGTTSKFDGWYDTKNKIHRIRVVSAMWKSRKRVAIKESVSKDGSTTYQNRVDEEYKKRKNEKVEYIDGEMPRHVVMLGPDICLSWGLMEQRFSYKESPWHCTLPVLTLIRDNTSGTSNIKSIAAKLYQLQQMASEILFEIRLAIKSIGDSRVLVYDTAQTPKALTKGAQSGLDRVMTHIKKDKIMFINSAEKGSGKKTFNQFTSLDLSQKGSLQDMFNGLNIIEDLASKFTGMTPEREGQVGQYQTASGTDRAIQGSAARTEILYTPFDEFIQSLLEKLILKAKQDYEENEVIHYVIGEMKNKFLKIYKDFFEADLGIYLSDPRKDKEAARRIDEAAQMALSNASTPDIIMGLIEVFEGESAVEKKAVFQRMLNDMEKRRLADQQAMAESQKEQAQVEQNKIDIDLLKSREGNVTEKEVAEIYTRGKANSDSTKANSEQLIAAANIESNERKEKKSE